MLLIGNRGGFARQRYDGPGGMASAGRFAFRGRRGVGDENAVPESGADVGADVVDVENGVGVGELLLENAGLDVGGKLLGRDLVHEFVFVSNGERVVPER